MRFCGRSAFPASFNPRAREGRDHLSQGRRHISIGFNPRAREGRDDGEVAAARAQTGFNPRAREGRDHRPSQGIDETAKFQSTRPRGARLGR